MVLSRHEVGLFRVSSGSPWNSLPLGGALSQWNLCGTNSLATSDARASDSGHIYRVTVLYLGKPQIQDIGPIDWDVDIDTTFSFREGIA